MQRLLLKSVVSYYYFLYPTVEEIPKSILVYFYLYSREFYEEKTESADENMEYDYENWNAFCALQILEEYVNSPISYDVHLDLTAEEQAIYDTSMREYERANPLEYGNKEIKLNLTKYLECYYCIPEKNFTNAKSFAYRIR